MRTSFVFSLALALAITMVSSCNKSEQPEMISGKSTTICAQADVNTISKMTMGGRNGDVYPMSWDAEECSYLREVFRPSDGTEPSCNHTSSGNSFVKINEHSGQFSYTLEAQNAEGEYDYVAIYPCAADNYKTNLTHGVRYGGTDAKNRVSYILNHTVNQMPEADGPDQSTHIMLAYKKGFSAQPSQLAFEFKPVVAYGKMTVKNFPALAPDETVSKITISAPTGKVMCGRVYHYFNATGSYAIDDVIPYNSSNVKNNVTIDPSKISFNTSGFDVWFTTLPFEMAEGEALSLSVESSVKTYTANIAVSKALNFRAGEVSGFIYDYLKGQPKAETKTLEFDFSSSTPLEGWPSEDKWDTKPGNKSCIYNMDGVDYSFFLTDCDNATAARTFWSTDGRGVVLGAVYRYLGLPAISGYKLIEASFVQGTNDSNGRKAGIVKEVAPTSQSEHIFVSGGESQSWTQKAATYTYLLSDTQENTMYYLVCTKGGVGATKITLTYEKVN